MEPSLNSAWSDVNEGFLLSTFHRAHSHARRLGIRTFHIHSRNAW
jgi:hypothetical protein